MRFHVRTNQAPDEDPYERYMEYMRQFEQSGSCVDDVPTDDACVQVRHRQARQVARWVIEGASPLEPPAVETLKPSKDFL